jgi:hypothetical protein
MIVNYGVKGSYDFNPLSFREDTDGRLWVKAYAPNGATAKTPGVVSFSMVTPFGYMFQTAALATATSAWAYVGVPAATYASTTQGWFQIGGIASQTILGASLTGTAGIGLGWRSASGLCPNIGASASSSLISETSVAACYCYAQSGATTTHDVFLFGIMVQNVG